MTGICNFEAQEQLGVTGNVKFCNGYAFKIYYGTQELTTLFHDPSIHVVLDSPEALRMAKKEINELLIQNILADSDIVAPETQLYFFYGAPPQELEQRLLSTVRSHYDGSKLIQNWFAALQTQNLIPFSQVLAEKKIPTNNDYIFFATSKQMSGVISRYIADETSIQKHKDTLIAIMQKFNQLHNIYNISHNDARFANILYQKLAESEEQILPFVGSDGTTTNVTVHLDIRVYLTDFEWSYCNFPIHGYQVTVPEYISADELDPDKRPIVPFIGYDQLPEDLRDPNDTYKYGTYYRGFDHLQRTEKAELINTFSQVYPRLFTTDILIFVTECLKYGTFDNRDISIILNFYFTNYVRISTNDTEPRYRGTTDYLKVSAYGFAMDIISFGTRVGI